MPGKLSTHVLDLTTGRPAAGMKIELWKHDAKPALIKTVTTNADGRTDAPVLVPAEISAGCYELVFLVGDYFSPASGEPGRAVPFLDKVPVRFNLADASTAYHVPLLVTPWAYSTYRGS